MYRHLHAPRRGRIKFRGERCRYVRCGAWLEGLEDFDRGIFGLAPGDALTLDPQARILLEQVQVRLTSKLSRFTLVLYNTAQALVWCRRLPEHLGNRCSSTNVLLVCMLAACTQSFWILCLSLWCVTPSASETTPIPYLWKAAAASNSMT